MFWSILSNECKFELWWFINGSSVQSLKFRLRGHKKEHVNLPNDLFLHNFGTVMGGKLHFGKGHESILRREARKVGTDNINWKTVPRLWSVKWNSNWPSTTQIGKSFMWSILALQPWPRNCSSFPCLQPFHQFRVSHFLHRRNKFYAFEV